MGLGHCYCGEIDTRVIAWYQSLGTRTPRSSWDRFRPLHAWCVSCCVQICVPCFLLRDCVLHTAWKTYTRYDVYGKCDCMIIAQENYMHDILYIGRSGMLRLGIITLGVWKMK